MVHTFPAGQNRPLSGAELQYREQDLASYTVKREGAVNSANATFEWGHSLWGRLQLRFSWMDLNDF